MFVPDRPPKVELALLPTPLMECVRLGRNLGRVWVKRDDLSNAVVGNSKLRSLEYWIGAARARGASALLVCGRIGSNHLLAASYHGRQLGLTVRALTIPQPPGEHVNRYMAAHRCWGTEVVQLNATDSLRLSSSTVRGELLRLQQRGAVPFAIPFGGAGVQGLLGYIEGGIELAGQLVQIGAQPLQVYVPTASATTVVGVAMGMALCNVRAAVVAVDVVGPEFLTAVSFRKTVRRLHAEAQPYLKSAPSVCRLLEMLEFRSGFCGPAYGVDTLAAAQARALFEDREGLQLDAVYASKAASALLADATTARPPLSNYVLWRAA